MTEDVILDVTMDFILSSETNLKLALQVERAMPQVREQLVRAALKAVEERFSGSDWTIDQPATQDVMATHATLTFRNKNWPGEGRDSEPRITLSSDRRNWTSVWVGVYFSASDFDRVQEDGVITPSIESRGFSPNSSEDVPYLWRYLDGELRDWSSERFMTKMSREDGQSPSSHNSGA